MIKYILNITYNAYNFLFLYIYNFFFNNRSYFWKGVEQSVHIASFMKWSEMGEGEPLWVVTKPPFETRQGSKIANERSPFGTEWGAPVFYMCCHTQELYIEIVFVLTASLGSTKTNSTVDFNSCKSCTLGTCPLSFGGDHIMVIPLYSHTIPL